MQEILQTLSKRTSILIILTGLILLLIGAAGDVTISSFSLRIPDIGGRIVLDVIGILLIGFGIHLIWRETKNEHSSQEISHHSSRSSVIKLEDRSGFTVPIETRCADATEIWILGFNLIGIVTHYDQFFLKKARDGCKFKFLITDPKSPAMGVAPEVPQQHIPIEDLLTSRKRDTESVIARLGSIIQTGNAELRVQSTVPPFALFMTDPETPKGEIQVGLYIYKVPPSERPHFILTPTNDEKWFSFFKEQFYKLWVDAQSL